MVIVVIEKVIGLSTELAHNMKKINKDTDKRRSVYAPLAQTSNMKIVRIVYSKQRVK
jgi:hypothetical protein